MVALSSMGNLLFGQSSLSFISFFKSFQTLFYKQRSPEAAGGLHSCWSDFTRSAFLFLHLTFSLVWMALVHMSQTVLFSPLFFYMLFFTVYLEKKKVVSIIPQVTGVMSSLARNSRRSQSRSNFFPVAQIFAHMRQIVSGFVGKRGKVQVESVLKEKVSATE